MDHSRTPETDRPTRVQAASAAIQPALAPAAVVVAATSSPAFNALSEFMSISGLGTDTSALAICTAAAAMATGAVMVEVQRAVRAWSASNTFRSMVKSFFGAKGMDPRIEDGIRSVAVGPDRPPLLVELHRVVKDNAFFAGMKPRDKCFAILPSGDVMAIRTAYDLRSVFADGTTPTKVTISELTEAKPLRDGLGVAWPGHIEVTVRAHGALRGQWFLDPTGQTIEAHGEWVALAASALRPRRDARVEELGYTELRAPDPHKAFRPAFSPA